jgi:2-dehydropantoate 2-reductase
VTTQNGVEADEIVRRSLPDRRVLAGLVYVAAARTAPGEIRQDSAFFRLAFGPRDGVNTPQSVRLEAACRAAGIEATLAGDIVPRLWTKLVFLASVSAVACMSHLQIGAIRSCDETRALLTDAMREVVAVGRAHGVALAEGAVEEALATVDSLADATTPSMHKDLLAGRRLEIEFLSGAVYRLGREKGVATPIHRVAYACLKPHAAGAARER